MKKQGFTLLELLAVIVILAIIALISTPIVLKMIEKSKMGAAESSAYAYVKATETSAVAYLLDNQPIALQGNYTIGTEGVLTSGTITLEPKLKGTKPSEGTVTLNEKGTVTNVTGLKMNGYNVCYDTTKNKFKASKEACSGSSEEPTPPEETNKWTYIDTDGDGTINVGDKITFGTESFYIISNNGTNIKALAEYNLYVGRGYSSSKWTTYGSEATGLQDSTMRGVIIDQVTRNGVTAFSAKYSYYGGSIVEGYVNAYKTKLEGLGAKVIRALLITKGELITLGCNSSAKTCSSAPSWIRTTSYWTYSSDNSSDVYAVLSHGDYPSYDFDDNYYSNDFYFGVRPVITIATSDIS